MDVVAVTAEHNHDPLSEQEIFEYGRTVKVELGSMILNHLQHLQVASEELKQDSWLKQLITSPSQQANQLTLNSASVVLQIQGKQEETVPV